MWTERVASTNQSQELRDRCLTIIVAEIQLLPVPPLGDWVVETNWTIAPIDVETTWQPITFNDGV